MGGGCTVRRIVRVLTSIALLRAERDEHFRQGTIVVQHSHVQRRQSIAIYTEIHKVKRKNIILM